jgi:cytochrome P450
MDLMRLALRMVDARLRGRPTGETFAYWTRDIASREDTPAVQLPLGHLEIVATREYSDQVLTCPIGPGGYGVAPIKAKAMRFLAPHALTITDGDDWTWLRAFNESVLEGGAAHPLAPAILAAVRRAFTRRISDRVDVQAAMSQVMSTIVLGQGDDAREAAEDARVLFDVVQSPLRRAFLGWSYRNRRRRFYATLERRWKSATDQPTLIAYAKLLAPDGDRQQLIEQIPNWMFTFTGSGTTLLTRTLALLCARPEERSRALSEIRSIGSMDVPEHVGQLMFVESCILEAGRLFPPVTRTFHAAPDGRQIVHYFPMLQRDRRLGNDVHRFCPDRWLDGDVDAAEAASNLFLRGPRSCPGMSLILFVCKAAVAHCLAELKIETKGRQLFVDRLPITFPESAARFITRPSAPVAHLVNAESHKS